MLAEPAKLSQYTKRFEHEYLKDCNYGCLAAASRSDLITAGSREHESQLCAAIHGDCDVSALRVYESES